MELKNLIHYCNNYLFIDKFDDNSLNGLQVEGKQEISKIVVGVSACKELFDKAVEKKVDAVIVHHGLFWGEVKPITNVLKGRIQTLLDNDISLLAYHLPLDANENLGNNILISKELGLRNIEKFLEYNGNKIGFKGEIKPIDFDSFIKKIEEKLGNISFKFNANRKVNKIGVCSGGASRDVEQAFEENLDTYITGEVGEPTLAYCKEANINYIAIGHYNSETWGIYALGKHLSKKFGIDVEFIKIDNPN